MKKSISNSFLYVIGVGIFVFAWYVLSVVIGEKSMILPGPFETFKYAFQLLKKSYTYKCIYMTSIRMVKGFLIALLLAFFFGVVAGNFKVIRKIIQPSIVVLRTIPTACLIYLFIVLAGFKNAPMYLVTIVSFPILYEGIVTGVSNIDKDILDAVKISRANFFQENLKIRIPMAKPYIVSSILSSFSLSFKIEIMAEVITGGSNPGLGNVIQSVRAYNPTNLLPVFGYSLIAIVMMLLIDYMIAIISNNQ